MRTRRTGLFAAGSWSMGAWLLAPADTGVAEKLNGPLGLVVEQGDVESFQVTANGAWVVYLANETGPAELYRVPSGGGSSVRISQVGHTVLDFRLSPTRAVYRASEAGTIGLYSTTGSGTLVKLNGPLVSGGSFFSWALSPDGLRVVYLADQDTNDVFELYSVPIDGSASPVVLNQMLVTGGDLGSFAISPDGTRVVFSGDALVDERTELFAVPIDGSAAPVVLNGPLVAGGDVEAAGFQLSPDGSVVAYLADELVDGKVELFRVPIDASAAALRLNSPLVSGGNVDSFAFTADGARVVYRADQVVDGTFGLHAAPSDASLAALQLAGTCAFFVLSPDSTHAVFLDSGANAELWSVPVDASLAPLRITNFPAGVGIHSPTVSPDSSRVVFLAGQLRLRVYSVPIDGGTVLQERSGRPRLRYVQ